MKRKNLTVALLVYFILILVIVEGDVKLELFKF